MARHTVGFLCLAASTIFLVSSSSAQNQSRLPIQDFELLAPYWTTETGWNTELQLRNSLERDLIVTPALRTMDGAETLLPPVTIKPQDVASVDLQQTLLKVAPSLVGSWGAIVFRYQSQVSRPVFASVMVRMENRPIAFHMDASFHTMLTATGSREGIWWMKDSATDYLVLTNTATRRIAATLSLYDANGKSSVQKLTFSPRQSQRFSLRPLLLQAGLRGEYGGIKVDAGNDAGSLDATHFTFDEIGGLGALMKMFARQPDVTFAERSWGGVTEWTTRAPMLSLTRPDPALGFPADTVLRPAVLLRNVTGDSFTVHARFNWWSDDTAGKTPAMNLRLRPFETKIVDVGSLQKQNFLPSGAHWASVILSAPVHPDDFMAVATSYDNTGRYGTQTPFRDQLAGHWEAGMWEVDSMHNSLVTIGNGGQKSVKARLTLFYNEGKEHYQVEQTIQPDEQM